MASINDKFIKTSVVEPTRLRDPLSSSATTLTVESTAGWNGDTAILAVIDRVDSAGNLTPDKMEIVIGTMNAGGLEQLRRGVGGRAQVHSSGAVVELSIAGSEQWNRAMDALISAFGQDGKIKESAFASGLQVVDGSVIKDGSIESSKLSKRGFGNFSTSEANTGFVWVDNKPIWKKTISVGQLPNNTVKSVAHGVSNIDQIIDIFGVANDGNTTIPLPFIHENTAISGIKITANRTNVNVGTGWDWSSYNQSYITILYTKR